jgi:regulatory protein YycI of two-component signal transduction system YycFG
MKTLYSIALSALIAINGFLSTAFAQNPAENWTLSQSESGNKNYVARESISLKPGFSYKATSGNTFRNCKFIIDTFKERFYNSIFH